MEYTDEDFLQLSGLQHFAFCRRQWALIHVEKQWAENLRTTEGNIFHERTHQDGLTEKRGDLLITRGMSIFSRRLGVSGKCDVLEFHRVSDGIVLQGQEGLWFPYPVEYKRGEPKEHNADALQLCGQAMCLEEMLACSIAEGALFYGETRRRQVVSFTDALRNQVNASLEEMHQLYQRGYTPKSSPSKSCNACSLKALCMPKLVKMQSTSAYLHEHLEALP